MGFDVKGICYEERADATAAAANDMNGQFVTFGGNPYVIQISYLEPNWPGHIWFDLLPVASGVPISREIDVVPKDCIAPLSLSSMSAADGGLLAGAVLAVWVVGWAVRTVIRTLRVDEVVSESE